MTAEPSEPIDLLRRPVPEAGPAPRRAGRLVPAVALAVVAAALVAGVVALGRGDGGEDRRPVVADAAVPGMVLDPLPEGFELWTVGLPLPDGESDADVATSSALFGDPRADDPFGSGDLVVEVRRGPGLAGAPAPPGPEHPTTVVRGVEADVVEDDGPTTIRWREGRDVEVGVRSWSLSTEELVSVAEAVDVDDPSALAPDVLPGGLELVGEQTHGGPAAPGSEEGLVSSVLYSGAGATLDVTSAGGLLDDGDVTRLEWDAGEAASEVVVRGHEGVFLRHRRPHDDGATLAWEEAPGHVVTLRVRGGAPFDGDELVAIAERLRPIGIEALRRREGVPG